MTVPNVIHFAPTFACPWKTAELHTRRIYSRGPRESPTTVPPCGGQFSSHISPPWRSTFPTARNPRRSAPTPGRGIEGTLPVSHMSTTGSDGGSEGVWRNVNMFRNTGEASKGVFYERVILVQSAEHLRWSCRNVCRTF